jgi:hypothetical protein
MLWEAGQRRVVREGRERLTELFVGVRDGYVAGLVASGQAKPRGSNRAPDYARADAAPPSAASQRATIGRLAAMFPGQVTGRMS